MTHLFLPGRRFPFRLPGAAILAGSLLFLVLGLNHEDPYQAAAGFFGILLIAGMVLTVYLRALNFKEIRLVWNTNGSLLSGKNNTQHSVYIVCPGLFSLFRIHLKLTGSLIHEKRKKYLINREFGFPGKGEFPLEWEIPVSGVLELAGRFYLRDVFGIAGFPLSTILYRQIQVFPAGGNSESIRLFPVKKETEDNASRKSQEKEKILMREYVAGDLHRDINWKAFSRIGELLTRIPPESAGKSRRIDLILRPFASRIPRNFDGEAVLELFKRNITTFCLQIFREYPETRIFLFIRPGMEAEFSTEDQENLVILIGNLDYLSIPDENDLYYPEGENIVFSTIYDDGLTRYLARLHPRSTSLHFIQTKGDQPEILDMTQGFPSFLPLFLPSFFTDKTVSSQLPRLEHLSRSVVKGIIN